MYQMITAPLDYGGITLKKRIIFAPTSLGVSGTAYEHYQRLCEMVHHWGCKIGAQLHQSDSNWKGMMKYIPGVITKKISKDDLRHRLNQEVEWYITEMPIKKIRTILYSFGESAVLVKKAGFDLIQVHEDRMCGSFSSPLFNHRQDQLGEM